ASAQDSTQNVVLAPQFGCTSPSGTVGADQAGEILKAAGPMTFSNAVIKPGLTYQWLRLDSQENEPWQPIVGERDSTYTLTAADVGSYVTVAISGTNGDADASPGGFATCPVPYPYGQIVKAATGKSPTPPAPKPIPVGKPHKPLGTPTVGNTLKSPPLSLPPDPSLAYQWFRLAPGAAGAALPYGQVDLGKHRAHYKAIRGAHHKKYRVKKKDKGYRIYVRVIVKARGYRKTTINSRSVRIR
ncbi:MAG TPA: hypothetical protein VGF84_21590, partial [Micromonosporaceae bacterium]